MKLGKRWLRMAQIYKRFAADYAAADFSQAAAEAMFLHESLGAAPPAADNGYMLGKKWMDVTVASWLEDLREGLLHSFELQADGYPDWFLARVGVLHK